MSDSSATIVLRSTSDDCPSWRSWTEISSGMNFFWNSTAPIPIDRIDSPNVSPYSGVASVYHRLPGAPSGFHCHGQNKKISSSASPENPPSSSQDATRRSARFSARVPATGQRGSR